MWISLASKNFATKRMILMQGPISDIKLNFSYRGVQSHGLLNSRCKVVQAL